MQNKYFNALSSFIFFITSSYLHSVIITVVFLIPFCELRTVCRRRRWGRDENGTAAELKLFELFEFALSESGSRASCARGLFTHD